MHEEDRDDWERHWADFAKSTEDNPAQSFRRRLILRLLGLAPGSTARVADIGSGQGDLAAALSDAFAHIEILGIEVSGSGVEVSQRKVPRARFVTRDLLQSETVPSDQRRWATHAVCSEVLEHVDHPDVLLGNALEYLEPGCRLVVTVPAGPMSAFDRHIGHRRHYNLPDLIAVLRSAGLDVEETMAAGFPFFNLYRLAVIARGEKLVDDVARQPGSSSRLSRIAIAVSRGLLRMNPPVKRGGWQLVAVARVPEVAA